MAGISPGSLTIKATSGGDARSRGSIEHNAALRVAVASKLDKRWSPGQISRWLRRRHPRRPGWHVCAETIYDAVYCGLIVPASPANLRTGRVYRHRRGRGRSKDGALKQCTTMKSIHDRPAHVDSRQQAGHWETQWFCQARCMCWGGRW
jgi:transposase, IS30 family